MGAWSAHGRMPAGAAPRLVSARMLALFGGQRAQVPRCRGPLPDCRHVDPLGLERTRSRPGASVPAPPNTTPAPRSSPASANPRSWCDRAPSRRSRRPSALAAASGLSIAVRSGGHGLLPVDDGLVVDLAEFTSVEVRPDGLVSRRRRCPMGATSPRSSRRTAWRSARATPATWASAASPSAAASAGSCASRASPSTRCARSSSSPRRARCSRSPPTSTPTCSGRCAAAAATSASSTRFVFQPIPGDGLVGGHVHFDTSDVPAVLRAWRDVMRGPSPTS